MKAYIERDIASQMVKIYLEVAPRQFLLYDRLQFRTDKVSEGAEAPYFLRLHTDTLEAIVNALHDSDVLMPAPTTREALIDARDTRDRLLALVERGWEALTRD